MVIKGSDENEELQHMFCLLSSACFANICNICNADPAWRNILAISVSICAMFIIYMIACKGLNLLTLVVKSEKSEHNPQPITEGEKFSFTAAVYFDIVNCAVNYQSSQRRL